MSYKTIDINTICDIARAAGAEILDVYQSDFDFETKGDGSPLTLADRKAHALIEQQLQALTPDIPVLSEESIDEVGDKRLGWSRYWLVDPLDGTKEFIKRNGEFTVNIALIDEGEPCIGVVYAPVLEALYFALRGEGAWKQVKQAQPERIHTRTLNLEKVKIVASRSHLSDEVKLFASSFDAYSKNVDLISMGSSLKLCLVAEGRADVYPRLGLTSEWDTAAAQCVVEAAGGKVFDCQLQPLRYGKLDILNPWFIVAGDTCVNYHCEGVSIPVL
jgi:3'(2'), 5'-bisphosphate nucleotidase